MLSEALYTQCQASTACAQADMVIMTNDSPMGEPPNEIIADMVAGYPDRILKRNASVPYQPGFLQDPGRVDFDALEFLWHNCYECAPCHAHAGCRSAPCPGL